MQRIIAPVQRSRSWCYTINNYTDQDEFRLSEGVAGAHLTYNVFGKEVGESGTPHLQGFCMFNTQRRFLGVKAIIGANAHVEIAKTIGAAINYCKKDGQFVEYGILPKCRTEAGQREQGRWDVIRQLVLDHDYLRLETEFFQEWSKYRRAWENYKTPIYREVMQDVGIDNWWISGPTGTGKSSQIAGYCKANNISYFKKPINKWFFNYNHETVVHVDEPYPGWAGKRQLIEWADRAPITVDVKNGHAYINIPQVYVTSNYSIAEVFADCPHVDLEAMRRRFKEISMDQPMDEQEFKRLESTNKLAPYTARPLVIDGFKAIMAGIPKKKPEPPKLSPSWQDYRIERYGEQHPKPGSCPPLVLKKRFKPDVIIE